MYEIHHIDSVRNRSDSVHPVTCGRTRWSFYYLNLFWMLLKRQPLLHMLALWYLPQYPPWRSPPPDFFCVYIFGPSDNLRDLEYYPSTLKELQPVGWSCVRHAGWSYAFVPLVWPTWRHCQCCTQLVYRTRSELRSRWATCTSKSVNFWMNSTK